MRRDGTGFVANEGGLASWRVGYSALASGRRVGVGAVAFAGIAAQRSRAMRIGFLFNHYAVHQVPHAAPYAFELSRRHPEHEVVIACSTPQEAAMAHEIARLYPGQRCRFVALHPSRLYDVLDPIVSHLTFGRKREVLRHNLDFFRTLDALVAPERNCLQLRTRFGLGNLQLIHTRHGAGDREGGFDDKSGAFDLTLLPGQKYVDRLHDKSMLRPGTFAVTGWTKFEAFGAMRAERPRLFPNDRPVIVYNPHFDQRVGSWAKVGRRVLEHFRRNPSFNLIFAPHVVLFRRSTRHGARLPRKYRHVPNILVDLGSKASADMTYLMAADIYLGDVSSQVYEFLVKPRPCIFLNAHHVSWKADPHYLFWNFGAVVDDVARDLPVALDRAFDTHPEYLESQRAAFAYTFHDEPGSTAAERGADAIVRFLAEQQRCTLPSRSTG